MAIIKPSIYISEMTGSADNGTMRKSKNRLTLAKKSNPTNPQTTKQMSVRGNFTGLSKKWQNLTLAQRASWDEFATTIYGRSALGEKATMSGFNAFLRCNLNLLKVGLSTIDVPSTPMSFPTCTVFGVAMEASGTPAEVSTVKLNTTFEAVSTAVSGKMVIYGTPILSAGLTPAKNKFKLVGIKTISIPVTPTVIATDVFTEYTAQVGSLDGFNTKANLKVAFKVCLIDENSGVEGAVYQDDILGSEVTSA